MNKLVIAIVLLAGGAFFIWNNDAALAKVCAKVDMVQNQFPVECTKARAFSLLK